MTATLITCTDCSAPLQHSIDRVIQVCEPCRAKWFALAVIGTPSREADDFEDMDDPCLTSAPLPASSWWEMSDGERETATKRQQAGMAGDVS
jgi:hypothetical protein